MNILTDNVKLYQGDCLEIMKDILDNSINLICVDLPYGSTELTWDKHINFKDMWDNFNRILSIKGNIVLFSTQPFTTKLINSNPSMFRYEIIWIKSRPTGFANANYRPMRIYWYLQNQVLVQQVIYMPIIILKD